MINTEAFTVIAGDISKWEEEYRARINAGESLVAVQVDQHTRGLQSARLSHGMFGWYVRAGNNLMYPSILFNTKERGGPLDGTLEAAVKAGTEWANEDPKNREFFAYKGDYSA